MLSKKYTNKNRNKTKLDEDGLLTIFDIHAVYEENNFKIRGLGLLGKLENSEAISVANKALPSALEAKKSPVASEAVAYSLEFGYDLAPLLSSENALIPFIKYDFVDSMSKTQGSIPNLDRYERTIHTAGINYFYRPNESPPTCFLFSNVKAPLST